ncbi:hypothetical protein BJX66DRAFT_351457 [Aspergillus keveii]|uniref:Peptidase M20 domain-containing protein 2 n=1 Tax=Aspergillus keveii TaxID=714993 RepID=A0ABR4G4T5_9EURO
MDYRDTIEKALASHDVHLREINKKVFDNPELGFEEHMAHDNYVSLLRSLGFEATPSAYGVPTAFVTEYGSGGRVVAFNAEYDALPDIGHACGHNLVGTASLAAFLGVVAALKESGIPGRVRLIGTPAEENLGGKAHLVRGGAFKDVDACLMTHPGPRGVFNQAPKTGNAYSTSLSMDKFIVSYSGKPAHAAMAPYQGVNALDAANLAYNAISMLRQQIKEHERIHFIIKHGGDAPNIIPIATKVDAQVRSGARSEIRALKARVLKCFEGAAVATGCTMKVEDICAYSDLRPNKPICSLYADEMAALGTPVECDLEKNIPAPGSTDQGNVCYECPAFHSGFDILTPPGAYNHTRGFTASAGSDEAYDRCIESAKGMAGAAWRILADDHIASEVKKAFLDDEEINPRD